MKVQELIDHLNATGVPNVSLWDPKDPESSKMYVTFNPILIKSKALLQREAREKRSRRQNIQHHKEKKP